MVGLNAVELGNISAVVPSNLQFQRLHAQSGHAAVGVLAVFQHLFYK